MQVDHALEELAEALEPIEHLMLDLVIGSKCIGSQLLKGSFRADPAYQECGFQSTKDDCVLAETSACTRGNVLSQPDAISYLASSLSLNALGRTHAAGVYQQCIDTHHQLPRMQP